jgi:uncharacterized Zn finger protein
MIRCPKTGKELKTGINVTKKEYYEGSALGTNTVRCPHCGKIHTWLKEESFLKENDYQIPY